MPQYCALWSVLNPSALLPSIKSGYQNTTLNLKHPQKHFATTQKCRTLILLRDREVKVITNVFSSELKSYQEYKTSIFLIKILLKLFAWSLIFCEKNHSFFLPFLTWNNARGYDIIRGSNKSVQSKILEHFAKKQNLFLFMKDA